MSYKIPKSFDMHSGMNRLGHVNFVKRTLSQFCKVLHFRCVTVSSMSPLCIRPCLHSSMVRSVNFKAFQKTENQNLLEGFILGLK